MLPERAAERMTGPHDKIERRGNEHRRRLREGFLAEANRRPGEIVVIDANQSEHAVASEVQRAALRVL
jgi:thymidylate kinase